MFLSTVKHSLIDFVNLKIKSLQSFKNIYKDRMYVYIFI
jgi:hypothetical protein